MQTSKVNNRATDVITYLVKAIRLNGIARTTCTLNSGQWTMDSGQWTVDNGQWTVDSEQ